jgi:hypothetical protein
MFPSSGKQDINILNANFDKFSSGMKVPRLDMWKISNKEKQLHILTLISIHL